MWADGLVPRSDGLIWECQDFNADGTHPSPPGTEKVATALLDFVHAAPVASGWYLGDSTPCEVHFCNPADGSANNLASIVINTGCELVPATKVGLTGGPAGQFCYLLIGDGTAVVHQPPGSVGDLCVTGGSCLGRYAQDIGPINAGGNFVTPLFGSKAGGAGFGIPTCGGELQAGQSWTFQYWHRQPMGAPSTFSEALRVTFNP